MDKSQRNRITAVIKHHNQQYLNSVANEIYFLNFEKRFAKLTRKVRSLTRKEYGSERSLSELSCLGRLVSGFMEDIKQKKAPAFNFLEYKKILNEYLINYLDIKRKNNYDGQCASYGETLFVLYLDLFITATVSTSERELQANPHFLVNPKTGSLLEIDILFEYFRLAFEFQGEHHYADPKTQEKDVFKLSECQKKRIILVPVNISQLNSSVLQGLIINSIKDFLGIHDLFTSKRKIFQPALTIKSEQLLNFCKITERLYTSVVVFDSCASWLDALAVRYVGNIRDRSPISSTLPAPRQTTPAGDLDVVTLYTRLKHVSTFRKKLRKPAK
ncbi:MAG: hypothetical protein ACFCVD_05010 [Nodosilinea sp.]